MVSSMLCVRYEAVALRVGHILDKVGMSRQDIAAVDTSLCYQDAIAFMESTDALFRTARPPSGISDGTRRSTRW